MLGELIDLVSGIGMGEPSDKAKDILGRVYQYFLGGFAGSEGKRGGEFLHAPLGRARAGRNVGAVQGACLRSVLRLRWHVRHLRAREQLHDVAARTALARTLVNGQPIEPYTFGQRRWSCLPDFCSAISE